jgi:xanthosine utilization system XapX-like protein
MRRGDSLVRLGGVLEGIRTGESDPADELSPRGWTLLQERLVTLSKVVAPVAAGYFPAFWLTWRGHPGVTDEHVSAHVFSPWTFALLGVHVAPWVVCRWQPLPGSWLRALDLAYCAAVGFVYSRMLLTHPSPPIVPLEGVLAIAAVLGVRALIVPRRSCGKTRSTPAAICIRWARSLTP